MQSCDCVEFGGFPHRFSKCLDFQSCVLQTYLYSCSFTKKNDFLWLKALCRRLFHQRKHKYLLFQRNVYLSFEKITVLTYISIIWAELKGNNLSNLYIKFILPVRLLDAQKISGSEGKLQVTLNLHRYFK